MKWKTSFGTGPTYKKLFVSKRVKARLCCLWTLTPAIVRLAPGGPSCPETKQKAKWRTRALLRCGRKIATKLISEDLPVSMTWRLVAQTDAILSIFERTFSHKCCEIKSVKRNCSQIVQGQLHVFYCFTCFYWVPSSRAIFCMKTVF